MTLLKKFFLLSWRKKKLYVQISWRLFFIRVSLKCLSFSRFKKIFSFIFQSNPKVDPTPIFTQVEIIQQIEIACDVFPFLNNCLSKALCAKLLLAKNGVPCQVVVGVSHLSASFQAHAWLERQGRPIAWKLDKDFVALPLFESKVFA